MEAERFDVDIQSDYLETIVASPPVSALAELIWNALDADARTVDVTFTCGAPDRPDAIIIADDGDGIPRADAITRFCTVGNSWKTARTQSTSGRVLHGRDGRGRLQAFALGRAVEWAVVYRRDGGLWTYAIRMSAQDAGYVHIGREVPAADAAATGVTLTITEPIDGFGALAAQDHHQALTETFAIYLLDYPDSARIFLGGRPVDAGSCVASRKSFNLSDVVVDEREYWMRLHVVEWRAPGSRAMYLCNQQRLPLLRMPRGVHAEPSHFAAYMYSPCFDRAQQDGVLALTETHPAIHTAIAEARHVLRGHCRARAAEAARSVVNEWKHDDVYPFAGEPVTPIERVEREVFDLVAINVARHLPDFDATAPRIKAFQLRMLRQAIEGSPDDLQTVLDEVLRLPRQPREDLAQLLRDTTLPSIIGATKVISERLKFLNGLEAILFDAEPRKRLKERSQLHRIIAQNCWLFGDEFGLSVDDQSLTQVLVEHRKLLGAEIAINEPVRHISQTRGIVDLMLSKTTKHHRTNQLSHLVVELKAPTVSVGPDEVQQILGYAFSVAADSRFSKVGVTWRFWVIGDELKPYTEHLVKDEAGLIFEKASISVCAKTYAQILDDNRTRLQFLQDQLDIQVNRDTSLRHLRQCYADFLDGVLDPEGEAEATMP